MTANFDAVPPVQGTALGESSIQVMELTGPLNAQQVALAQSNPITLASPHYRAMPHPETGWGNNFLST